MKYFSLLLILILLIAGCKKSSQLIDPNDENRIENENQVPDEGYDSETKEIFKTVEGIPYDNQRVSIPARTELNYFTNLYITLLDTIYRTQSGKIEWSILVPEKDSVSARWDVDAEIELKLSHNIKWIYNEQMWRYTFIAEIDKVTRSGSADVMVVLTNHTTDEVILRSTKVNVILELNISDINGARFGNTKSEAITNIQNYFQKINEFKPTWDELLPNVGFLPFNKYFGNNGTTYEFEGDRLVRVTEVGQWFSHPDSVVYTRRLEGVLNRFKCDKQPELIDYGHGRMILKSPISWHYNGLKLTFSERKYVFDGIEGRAIAFIIEKDEL